MKVEGVLTIKTTKKGRDLKARYISAKGKELEQTIGDGNRWFDAALAAEGDKLEIEFTGPGDWATAKVRLADKPEVPPTGPKLKSTSSAAASQKPSGQDLPQTPSSSPTAASKGIWATAPYNFIPYDPKRIIESAAPKAGEESWSGIIHCRLKAKEPLLVAGLESQTNRNDKPIKKRCFLEVQGRKVIPGSSLKGLLRSLVEVLSFSRLQPLNDRQLVYRNFRVERYKKLMGINVQDAQKKPCEKKGRQKAGWLIGRGGEYSIVPVEYEMTKTGACPCQVKTGPVPQKQKKSKDPCNYYYFAPIKSDDAEIRLNPDMKLDFDAQMTSAQEAILEERKLIGGREKMRTELPVFWVDDPDRPGGDPIFFGLAKCFRVPYAYKPRNLANAVDQPDFAATLFGSVTKTAAVKGRISVSSAVLENPEQEEPQIATLGQPKPTCLPHYLVQDAEQVKVGKKNQDQIDPDTLTDYDNPHARLRGRKWYWHRSWTPNDLPRGNDNTDCELHPVKAGVTASFCIRIDRLSRVELGALLEALESNNGGWVHKLGLGKALGLGSVHLWVDRLEVEQEQKRYHSLSQRLKRLTQRTVSDFDPQTVRNEFKTFVLNKLRDMGETANDYEKLEPIKVLRAMMDYNNKPQNALTANMKLHDGAISYKTKAVLKDALEVYNTSQILPA